MKDAELKQGVGLLTLEKAKAFATTINILDNMPDLYSPFAAFGPSDYKLKCD